MKFLRRLGVSGTAQVMDNLTYKFQNINGNPTNRLDTLFDSGTVPNTIALANTIHPYKYDHSGNLIIDGESDIGEIKWTADGKVERIIKTSNGAAIVFVYDARGDRVCKAVLGEEYEYYLRDANGEILEILKVKFTDIEGGIENDPWTILDFYPTITESRINTKQKNDGQKHKKNYDFDKLMSETCDFSSSFDSVQSFWYCWDTTSLDIIDTYINPFLNPANQVTHTLEYIIAAKNEWYIYGSAGHGRFARAFPHDNDRRGYSNTILGELDTVKRYLKQKQYELKDHLGNVRAVLSDMKISTTANDSLAPFKADVLAAYSHYPFGMLQPGMYSEAGTPYRFGFNGMLRDDEVKDLGGYTVPPNEGIGNSYDFGARMYDPRVARFFSLDPMKDKFSWQSSYVFAANNPVKFIDKDGKEPSQNQAVSLNDYIPRLIIANVNTFEDLRKVHASERYRGLYESAGPLSFVRYLYSEKWGWIDMLHFSESALKTSKDGVFSTLKSGETLEVTQKLTAPASSFSYEDLVSNLIGASFAEYNNNNNSKEFLVNLQDFLIGAGFNAQPTEAVNWGELPRTQVRGVPIGIKNYSYIPLFAPYINERKSTIDKYILNQLKTYETEVQKEKEELRKNTLEIKD
jgi:RHS repeat-associated protein